MNSGKKKTPKSDRKTPSAESPNTSRYETVAVSPGRSPSQGNLTGSARKVKDGAADWHNYRQKWEVYNGRGLDVITQIGNLRLQTQYDKEQGMEAVVVSGMPEGLEALCFKLQGICDSMAKLVTKLEALTSSLKGIADLEWYQNDSAWDPEPLFQTWPTMKFYETSQELLCMYQKELQLKKTIMQNVAHTADRNLIMYYSATWLHQPYIELSADLLLESFLQETGHR